jgi:outer membrane lipoprotein-sorting protein
MREVSMISIRKQTILTAVLLIALVCILSNAFAGSAGMTEGAETAQSILEKADEIRFPRESFQVDVTIKTTSSESLAEKRTFRVLSKGNENSIVMTTEPASERGQTMLMRGRDLWIFMPNVSQPIRLSLSQRLTGQVANGDIARANFSGDYNPELLGTDHIDEKDYYILELTARDRSVTYQKVVLWVQKLNYWPYRAEFYSLSNRLIKTAHYENFQMILGQLRPTRLIMQDELRKEEISVLDYFQMELRDLPDKIFTKNYLKRIE